jgi:3-methylcrotonyl-CoA carboxylase beta subunit
MKGTELWNWGLWAALRNVLRIRRRTRLRVSSPELGRVCGRLCMIIANDATVKAGAFFPMTAKKVLRAQTIALENRIPTLYLVDSSGMFLPLQEDVFPDTDDFGRVFRNNAVMSSLGIPQITAIMGMCVAGGAYLPVMTDTILMTEGSGLFLAGPSLVQAAIGQKTDPEELGGATMHAEISGTVDFKEPNDHLCIARLRSLVGKMGSTAQTFHCRNGSDDECDRIRPNAR